MCATHCRPGRPPSPAQGHRAACGSAGGQGVGHAADRVWSVPRPAPPQELALVGDVRVRSKYGEVTLISVSKVPLLNAKGRFSFRDNKDTLSLCALPWCKSLIASGGGGSSVPSNPSASLQAARPPLIRKIQLFVYIHFPHSDYFINCPAFISSLPIPPNNQFFYPDQQTHHRSFVDSKDLLSLLKEPLFFDDWVAANFKAINLSSDWLAAQQSPYQILGGDPEALRTRAGRASGARAGGEDSEARWAADRPRLRVSMPRRPRPTPQRAAFKQ